ncbi:MAG: hypothetical protein V2B19_32625 [Pseudomonadota bacterium]
MDIIYEPATRRIYSVEKGEFPNAGIRYVSASYRHCEDSPCAMGCPTGALQFGTANTVFIRSAC